MVFAVWSLLAVIAHEAEESESKRVRDVDRTLDAAYGPRCRCRQMEPLVGTCMLRVVLLLCSVTHTHCAHSSCVLVWSDIQSTSTASVESMEAFVSHVTVSTRRCYSGVYYVHLVCGRTCP